MSILLPRRVRQRRVYFPAVLAAMPLLCRAFLWVRPDEPGAFTRANFDRIRVGMPFGEVVHILGPPVHSLRLQGVQPSTAPAGAPTTEHRWETDSAEGYVLASRTGAVTEMAFAELPPRVNARRWWRQAIGSDPPF